MNHSSRSNQPNNTPEQSDDNNMEGVFEESMSKILNYVLHEDVNAMQIQFEEFLQEIYQQGKIIGKQIALTVYFVCLLVIGSSWHSMFVGAVFNHFFNYVGLVGRFCTYIDKRWVSMRQLPYFQVLLVLVVINMLEFALHRIYISKWINSIAHVLLESLLYEFVFWRFVAITRQYNLRMQALFLLIESLVLLYFPVDFIHYCYNLWIKSIDFYTPATIFYGFAAIVFTCLICKNVVDGYRNMYSKYRKLWRKLPPKLHSPAWLFVEVGCNWYLPYTKQWLYAVGAVLLTKVVVYINSLQ